MSDMRASYPTLRAESQVLDRPVRSEVIDSIASNAIFSPMGATLTIRNLNDEVKQKLRLRAASHQTSMEAEARAILTQAVNAPDALAPPSSDQELNERLEAIRGLWKNRTKGRDTDQIMKELRGDE